MTLTAEQHANRDTKIGASFLPYLMAGDEAKILNEWRRLVGDPAYEREDLSDVWAVQLGSYLETFAIDWHERKTGSTLSRRQQWFSHPDRPFMGCHIDCFRDDDATVIDAKVVGAYRKLDDVIALYTPQMIAQKACTKARSAALLIVHGGAEPAEYPVTWDDAYEAELWARVDAFWRCVETLTLPFHMEVAAAPVPATRTVDMLGNNEWASEVACWLATKDAAKQFDASARAIKALVPADAVKAHGYGVIAFRNKAGALSIRETTA